MEEIKTTFFDKVYNWFNKDPKSAFITILIIALVFLFFENASLQQKRIDDKDKFKDEIIKEVRQAYDPKFKEIKDTVLSKSDKLDTAIQAVKDYVNNKQNKK